MGGVKDAAQIKTKYTVIPATDIKREIQKVGTAFEAVANATYYF